MKLITHFLEFTLALFLTIGISACSQDKRSEAQSIQQPNAEPISVTMYKNSTCKCCSKWTAYMEENGYSVTSIPSENLATIKSEHGVPENLRACHTALIDDYVVEGHVPVKAINKLLKNRPDAKGIAVPGMPAGAPGMTENPSTVDVYFFNGPDQMAYFGKF